MSLREWYDESRELNADNFLDLKKKRDASLMQTTILKRLSLTRGHSNAESMKVKIWLYLDDYLRSATDDSQRCKSRGFRWMRGVANPSGARKLKTYLLVPNVLHLWTDRTVYTGYGHALNLALTPTLSLTLLTKANWVFAFPLWCCSVDSGIEAKFQ